MKMKKAFTLAEAILTMTILGIIAAVMITTLKPAAYKSQGLTVLKQKVYNELDGVSQTVLVECCKNMSFASVYGSTASCAKNQTTSTFDANIVNKYANYMRGTIGACGALTVQENKIDGTTPKNVSYTAASSLKLRDGSCIYFKAIASTETGYYDASDRIGSILVDVNGNEGPNATGDDNDRIVFYVGKDGITSDMPKN